MKRTLSLLVALVMVISMVPNVFAADDSVDFDDLIYLDTYSPLTVNIEADAAEPVEFLWIPEEEGTLTYDINNADTTVSIVLTQGENTATSEAGVVALAVVAGEEVSIKISDTTGAAVENLVINGTFGKECEHVPGEPVQENVVEATCTEAGSYDSVVYCTLCGEKLSSTVVELPVAEHPWDEGVKYPATTEKNAYTLYTCTVCGATKEEEEEGTQLPTFKITKQPTDQNVILNQYATFTVEAVGAVSYQWQRLKSGATAFTNCSFSGYNTATLKVKANGSNQTPFRCVITDAAGNQLISEVVTYTTYIPEPSTNITGQDGDKVVQLNKEVSFSVTVENPDAIVSYHWQKRNPAGTYWLYTALPGYDTDTITMNATRNKQKYYRCEMTDINGAKIYSEEVTFTFAESPIKLEILDYSKLSYAMSGTMVQLFVTVQGSNPTYEWQRSRDGGLTWQTTSMGEGYNAANFSFGISRNNDFDSANNLYRCVVRDDYGGSVTSRGIKAIRLTKEFKINTQPTDQVMEGGNPVQFTVAAQGTTLTYQWQYTKTIGGDFVNTSMTGYNTNTLTVTSQNHAGKSFRCMITDRDGTILYTDPVTYTVAE